MHPQKGAYIAGEASGWDRSQVPGEGGVVTFESSLKELRGLRVGFSTVERGSLYAFVVSSRDLRPPVEFLSPKVLVVFKSSGRELECDADEMPNIGRALNIPVGDETEFTVTIPAFRYRDRVLPELKAEFIWSDRTYWYIRGIQ
jgi:hypothetical protein